MRKALLAAACLLTGCPGFGDETLADRAGIDEVPTYEADIKPLLEQYCTTCHGDPLRAGAPVKLHTYANAERLAARILVRAVQQQSMPPGGGISDPTDRALLEAWINGGAPRGDVDPDGAVEPDMAIPDAGVDPDMAIEPDAAPDPDDGIEPDVGPPPPTWNDDVGPIFEEHCTICHGGANPTGNLSLETYNGFRAGGFRGDLTGGGDPAQSLIIDRLRARNGESLMPQGGDPLAEEKIVTIEQWIAAGIPEGT